MQTPRKLPGPIGFTEPRRHREGVMLVGVRTSAGNVHPMGRADLRHGRLSSLDRRAVERPELLAATGCLRRYSSQGMPAWVDLATEPRTSKWNTHLAEPARCSVIRRQQVYRYAQRRCRPGGGAQNQHKCARHPSASGAGSPPETSASPVPASAPRNSAAEPSALLTAIKMPGQP